MEKKQDMRYSRTHELIRSEFIKQMSEKEFRSISVSEIARCCGINRKTFYLHFDSTDDLMRELSNEFLYMLTEKTNEYVKTTETPTYKGLFFLLDSVIRANYNFYICVLTSHQYMNLIFQFLNHLAELFSPFISRSFPFSETQRRMMVIGVASAVFEMHRRNYVEDLGYSSEEIFDLTSKYIYIDYLVREDS